MGQLLRFCLILALLSVGLALMPKRLRAEPPRVKIGAIVAQSGPLSSVGSTIRNAILMAQEKQAPDHDVEFVFEDDAFLPRNAVSAAQKLLLDPQVKALLVFGGSTSQAVSKLTNPKKVPLAALTILDPVTSGDDSTFQFFVSSAEMNRVTEDEIRRREIASLALLATQQDATLFQRDNFAALTHSQVLLSEDILPGDLDMRSLASRVKQLNPAGVFAFMLPPQGSIFAKQLRQAGYRGQFIASLQFGVPSEIENAEGATDGAFFACGDDRRATGFYEDYREKFPDSSPFSETVFGYDTAQILIAAARSGNIAEYLRSVRNYPGVLGDISATGRNSFSFGAALKKISNGGVQFIQ